MGIVKALHHVKLKCTKETFEDVLHFYVDVLGLKILGKHPDCAILDTGSGIVEVFNDAEELLPQGYFVHIAFATDDVRSAIKTVEDAGYKIKEYPVDVMFDLGGPGPSPARIAFCWGPVGEEIEFFEVREGKTD